MNQSDIAALMKGAAPVIRDYVAEALAPLTLRIAELESRAADQPAPPLLVSGAMIDRGGNLVLTYSDGSTREIGHVVGKDADTSGLPDMVTAAVDGAVAKAIADLPAPERGERGERGADGRDGVDGKDADLSGLPEMIAAAVAEAVPEAVARAIGEMPPPERGEKGEKGEPGERGERGAPGAHGRDGVDGVGLAGALIDRGGGLVVTLTDGTTRELGQVVGKDGAPGADGRDGLGFEDMSVDYDGRRGITLRFARGEVVKEFAFSMPVVIDAGVWRDGKSYEAGDGVTWAGSYWIAQKDTTDKPDASDAWRLSVKRGRDAKAAPVTLQNG